MKIVAIIQARMGSTRLPGKVLMDLGGESVLARVVHRLRRAELIGKMVIATTERDCDDVIIDECHRLNVDVFRGSEQDVLDRYYRAAAWAEADAIVRITSDCPLIDPEITDKVIRAFQQDSPDYASNTLERTYPRGLDTEIMSARTLARAWEGAGKRYQREHVTAYIYEHPEKFVLCSVANDLDYSHYRWTLDTPEDLSFIRAVYEAMGNVDDFSWREVLDLLKRRPELAELNRMVLQKALHEA